MVASFKNLKMRQTSSCCLRPPNTFDYQNWHPLVEYKEQLSYWPSSFNLVFNKLVNCQIPLQYFKENYLQISRLEVRQVTDQPLLVDFLRNVSFGFLELAYDCNLGQSFLDEIASSVSIGNLVLDECVLHRLSDLSVLSRLNTHYFTLHFQQFQREVALAVLRNPACVLLDFECHSGFNDEEDDGEIRKMYKKDYSCFHTVYKKKNEFYCKPCMWISSKDPNRSEDQMEVTIQHMAKQLSRPGTNWNMTLEEVPKLHRRFQG